MFLKKKYVLVKHEHEISLFKKLLVAAVILVTVFAMPILLRFFVQSLQSERANVNNNNSSSNCDREGGCFHDKGENHLGNLTEGETGETEDKGVVPETEWIITTSSVITSLNTEDEDYYNEYPTTGDHEMNGGFDYTTNANIREETTTEDSEWGDIYKTDKENYDEPWNFDPYEKAANATIEEDVTGFPVVTQSIDVVAGRETNQIVDEFYGARKDLNLSTLGEILFRRGDYPPPKDKHFKILIWKDGAFLARRHINYFSGISHDPFDECSVENCVLSYDMDDLTSADAVVFLLLRQSLSTLPDLTQERPPGQRWIFLSDENPYNTFLDKTSHWSNYSGIFNWSMTYRMESDIPVANARVIPIQSHPSESTNLESLIPNYETKQRNVLMAVTLTNCSENNPVMAYITDMQKYMDIDIYGKCGNLSTACPTHFAKDCPELNKYMFYFAYESGHCNEYMSQKLFWNTFEKGAIPVLAGVSLDDCKKTLPPNSYLNIENFINAQDLAMNILHINNTWDESYWKLHEWRNDFKVKNEHGYFGSKSFHYCRICEALNYNDEEAKVYNDLSYYLSPDVNCGV